jgi:hypothetical protein
MPHLQNPSTQNPLALAGREKHARTFYARHQNSGD